MYPTPHQFADEIFWFRFTIENEKEPWEDDKNSGQHGINNMNTLPFENIPYENINSIGKQWIRRFALSLCKEMLGYVRSKFGSIPIPGESVNLNGSDLISAAKSEQQALRDELKTTLDELTYAKLAERDAGVIDSTTKVQERMVYPVPFVLG